MLARRQSSYRVPGQFKRSDRIVLTTSKPYPHLEADVCRGYLGLHLLYPALKLVLVAKLIATFALVQLQSVQVRLMRP